MICTALHSQSDDGGRIGRIIVFPKAKDGPPIPHQLLVSVAITPAIAPDLLAPPCGVRFRPRPVAWAAVPEAAVYEDGDLCADERDIGASPRSRQRGVHAIAETEATKRGTEREFARRITSLGDLHTAPHMFG